MKIDYSKEIQSYQDFIKRFCEENDCTMEMCINSSFNADWTMPDSRDDLPEPQYEELVQKWYNVQEKFFKDSDIDEEVLIAKVLKDEEKYGQFIDSDT